MPLTHDEVMEQMAPYGRQQVITIGEPTKTRFSTDTDDQVVFANGRRHFQAENNTTLPQREKRKI